MKRLFVFLFLAATLSARAHVGSPNVFFDGNAGDYPVHIVVRPPNVVPGLAEIAVRVEGAGVQHVTALPVFGDAGKKGAPPPDEAKLVPGEINLYSATLWLMKPGGYSVNVNIEGAHGGGTVIVPVNAVAMNTLGMTRPFAVMMAVLAILLFVGAVRIAGAVFGESLLSPGETPSPSRILRGRIAMVVTAAFIAFALFGGKKWWDFKEKEYRNNTVYQAADLSARVVDRTNQNLLELEIGEGHESDVPVALLPDHGKMMHLFLIREPDLNVFAHLHPVKRTWQKFEVALPPLPAGRYAVYADITHETGFAETLTTNVVLPAPSPKIMQYWSGGTNDQICGIIRAAPPEGFPLPPDMDDSWHIDQRGGHATSNTVVRVSDDCSVFWIPPWELIENREVSLRFQFCGPDGKPKALEPYIGMFGHAVVRRDDGAVFAHIHPSGTYSMAAQEYFTGVTNTIHATANSAKPVYEVSFPFAFPNPGAYHIWVQLKSGGKAYTGVFQVTVKPAK